ncbi:MAG: adenosylcobinamide-phosphate synthase CbiB [Anaerolineaceae bacterium]
MTPLFAFLFDLLLGDPPNRFHPTAWMGKLIACWGRFRPHNKPAAEFISGAALILVGITLTGAVGYALTKLGNALPVPLNWLLVALILKTTISLRGLNHAAREVQTALDTHNLPEARRLLSWHLVSRDTSQLTEAQVAGAAIESVAENATDGILAPLFFFAVGGLPAALAYRFVNTADAMIGYRDPEHEWYGKFAARLDDALNLIPARLTGLFILAASFLVGENARQAWRTVRSDAHLTASPNAGVTMSAMAGALGVKLEKVGHYTLGEAFPLPSSRHLQLARRILFAAVLLAVAVLIPLPAANWVK